MEQRAFEYLRVIDVAGEGCLVTVRFSLPNGLHRSVVYPSCMLQYPLTIVSESLEHPLLTAGNVAYRFNTQAYE